MPGDEENNLKILTALNSQLEANTQTLNRGQQDRLMRNRCWRNKLRPGRLPKRRTNPQTMQKQLAQLQSQLITLQARYTDDHPDVVKTKNDIAELKRKLNEMNSAAPDADATDKSNATEPAGDPAIAAADPSV